MNSFFGNGHALQELDVGLQHNSNGRTPLLKHPNWKLGIDVIQHVSLQLLNLDPNDQEQAADLGADDRDEPVLIRRGYGAKLSIVSGYARARAAVKAGHTELPCRCDPLMYPDWELGMNVIQPVSLQLLNFDPDNPRQHASLGKMEELAEDLSANEMEEPLVIRRGFGPRDPNIYILSGHRRACAAQKAGYTEVPCRCDARRLNRGEVLERLCRYNLHREDMPAVDQARLYAELMKEKRISQQELASRLHINLPRLGRMLKLLELPTEVQEKVNRGEISETAAYWIRRASDDAMEQVRMSREVVSGKLTSPMIEKMVKGDGPGQLGRPSTNKSRTTTDRKWYVEELRTSVVVRCSNRQLTDAQIAEALEEVMSRLTVRMK